MSQSNVGMIVRACRAIEDPEVRRTVLHWIPWRAAGCELFACIDPEDTDTAGLNDEKIGTMCSEKLAEEAAMAHNASVRSVDRAATDGRRS